MTIKKSLMPVLQGDCKIGIKLFSVESLPIEELFPPTSNHEKELNAINNYSYH